MNVKTIALGTIAVAAVAGVGVATAAPAEAARDPYKYTSYVAKGGACASLIQSKVDGRMISFNASFTDKRGSLVEMGGNLYSVYGKGKRGYAWRTSDNAFIKFAKGGKVAKFAPYYGENGAVTFKVTKRSNACGMA